MWLELAVSLFPLSTGRVRGYAGCLLSIHFSLFSPPLSALQGLSQTLLSSCFWVSSANELRTKRGTAWVSPSPYFRKHLFQQLCLFLGSSFLHTAPLFIFPALSLLYYLLQQGLPWFYSPLVSNSLLLKYLRWFLLSDWTLIWDD